MNAAAPLRESETRAEPVLSVRDLSVTLPTEAGRVRLVDRVSFDIPRGKVVGLVGESGSGKSLTCHALARLLPLRAEVSGEVIFEGRNLLDLLERSLEDLRGSRIGYVFQDPMTSLNPSLTIGKQLIETLLRHGRGKAEARSRAVELLDMVGIPAAKRRLDSYPFEFSGGMRQRALIALALSCSPSLLIADEPTTALDVTVQAQILHLLREMQAELGLSVLFVTHDLGVVADICNEVTVLYAGEVVEQGGVDEIFATPRHPYTQSLLGALHRRRGEPLLVIPGSPPAAGAWDPGCRFRPRCTHAFAACGTHPRLRLQGKRTLRCHLPEGATA